MNRDIRYFGYLCSLLTSHTFIICLIMNQTPCIICFRLWSMIRYLLIILLYKMNNNKKLRKVTQFSQSHKWYMFVSVIKAMLQFQNSFLFTDMRENISDKLHVRLCAWMSQLLHHSAISQKWKPSKCPSAHEWINRVVSLYNGTLLAMKGFKYCYAWIWTTKTLHKEKGARHKCHILNEIPFGWNIRNPSSATH